MKKRKLVSDEWRVLSDKFVRHQKLPHGTKVILEHKPMSSGLKGRKARNDTTFTRRLFQGRAANDDTVTALIANHLVSYLTVAPADKGYVIKIVGPNGEEVKKPGTTHVKTIRAWTPQPTDDEVEVAELNEQEIEEIADVVDTEIRQTEEMREDSDRVLHGYIRALDRRFGRKAFKQAVEDETG